MLYLTSILILAAAYLLGSISFAVILSKKISGEDIRNSGSGNAGATNMLRTYGKKVGVYTLLLDALKGVIAVLVAIIVCNVLKDSFSKPFDAKEVIARIKAIARRMGSSASEPETKEVRYDKLVVNMTRYELRVNDKVLDTPPKELELLFYLASNPNHVYTRDQLLDEVWGFEYYGDSRTIDVHIKRLREKLQDVSPHWALKTVWGVGYKFEADEE